MEYDVDCDVKNIGCMGVIAGLFIEYQIIEKIDQLIPKRSNNHKITHGEVILAMILQGLGFGGQRLYLATEYFKQASLEGIFRPEIVANDFNATTMARTLDRIYEYGPTRFFTNLCLSIIMKNKMLTKLIHIDTTSFSVTGKKYKNEGSIELKKGYSKDHRMDLKQLVFLLATTEDGLPLLVESHSGNSTDGEIFQNAIKMIQNNLKEEVDDKLFVLDSSLYSKDFISNEYIKSSWITRVPESIKLCREALETNYFDDEWIIIDKDYKYVVLSSSYGGKVQRWVLVRNRKSKYKELASLKAWLITQEDLIRKKLNGIHSRKYSTKEAAIADITPLILNHKLFNITYNIIAVKNKVPKSKRKIARSYKIVGRFDRNDPAIRKKEMKKGLFILATNITDENEISSEQILKAYRSRNDAIEKNFKFYKCQENGFNKFYFQKESRIEAMLVVMSISLFINNLSQKKIREFLVNTGASVRNQKGKATQNPTFQWVRQLMGGITRTTIKIGNFVQVKYSEIDDSMATIINIFGAFARNIYGFS